MTIDWAHFTPWASFTGGLLIGTASAIFILLNGRILGISGIVGGLLLPKATDTAWRVLFLLGMLVSPWLFFLLAPVVSALFGAVMPSSLSALPEAWLQPPRIDASVVQIVVAGVLVGFGTRYGSGCTSGHGICGLSRLSFRSFVATGLFMFAGFVVVFVARHVL